MISLVPGAVIAGKYELERPLARGGMGAVWVARHRELGSAVAIKFMDGLFIGSPEARGRFEREARAAAQLDSNHVVHVYDYGVVDDTPYMAMELLKGEDLAARLARERKLSLSSVASIVTQVVKALRKAHEASLVHRDLKPANIFLAVKDDDEVVKVLDFGIAKSTGLGDAGNATVTGTLIGSVHFMSPEQARRSKEVDLRTDLWALGVIAFRALTGRLPFPGHEIGDVIVKICAEPVPVPSHVAPELPPAIDAFFVRALARNPGERFQSARELADAFNVAANGRGASHAALDLVGGSAGSDPTSGIGRSATLLVSVEPAGSAEARTVLLSTGTSSANLPAVVAEGAASRSAAVLPVSTLAPSQQTLIQPANDNRPRIVTGVVLLVVALGAVIGVGVVVKRGGGGSSATAASGREVTSRPLSASAAAPHEVASSALPAMPEPRVSASASNAAAPPPPLPHDLPPSRSADPAHTGTDVVADPPSKVARPSSSAGRNGLVDPWATPPKSTAGAPSAPPPSPPKFDPTSI